MKTHMVVMAVLVGCGAPPRQPGNPTLHQLSDNVTSATDQTDPAGGDDAAPTDNSPPPPPTDNGPPACVPSSTAAVCASAEMVCGTVTASNGCGHTATYDCGTCSTCVPETDAELCYGSCGANTATDRCGTVRQLTCDPCPCTVTTTDHDVCVAAGAACGAADGVDNCGGARHVANCAVCGDGTICKANQCEPCGGPLEPCCPSVAAWTCGDGMTCVFDYDSNALVCDSIGYSGAPCIDTDGDGWGDHCHENPTMVDCMTSGTNPTGVCTAPPGGHCATGQGTKGSTCDAGMCCGTGTPLGTHLTCTDLGDGTLRCE